MSSDARPVRLIWITPKFPLGTPDGARHATCTLLRHLADQNVSIDLICLVPRGEATDEAAARKQLGVRSCTLIPRNDSRVLPLPGLLTPFTFRTFADRDVRIALQKELTRLRRPLRPNPDTYVVFDGLHTFAALSDRDLQTLSSTCQGVIYRAHNVETVLWEQCAERARWPWFRLFFQYQAALVRSFERRVAHRVSWVTPVSLEDAHRFERMAPRAVVGVTPIGMDFPKEEAVHPVRPTTALELLFIGRLDWLPNREGLLWFLESIWPQVIRKRPQAILKIAGHGESTWLQRFRQLPGIDILGRVDSVEPLYQSCVLSIAPLFQGSGTRVKILESARYQRAVLTTALGAEGSGLIPGESYFRAESSAEWLALLETVKVEDCRTIGLRAYREARERFESRKIAKRFLQAVTHRE